MCQDLLRCVTGTLNNTDFPGGMLSNELTSKSYPMGIPASWDDSELWVLSGGEPLPTP